MSRQREAGILIAKIHQLSGRIFNQKLKNNKLDKLNPAQGRIMFVLWNKNSLPIHELSKETQLSKSTLTSMLDRLEEAGYIKRSPSKKDRRKIIINLIKVDKEFEQNYINVSNEMLNLFYNGFSEEEIDRFESFLKRLLNNLLEFEAKN
jgi:DNA-binding MarR family transcriptional regulator